MNATNIFKPILFSTEMVQAILAGRKTQTRRIHGLQIINKNPDIFGLGDVVLNNHYNFYKLATEKGMMIPMKYIEGDILWVRETFHDCSFYNEKSYLYKAEFTKDERSLVIWKPSIFMPKEACRIFLKVTNVRCERLNDISEHDAIAEGIKLLFNQDHGKNLPVYQDYRFSEEIGTITPTISFCSLWNSINAKKHPWKSNPWVWVYDFKRIEKPEDFN
ncbi:hypothetical protein [Chryseobacterium sp. MP_3.2]|uniref:hypothetical protein n=1 Tax=Chryseobacterium sp. MP_3.2 TaxID=3071712 RepID=UPI002E04B8BD|nr:hypothetical protein [Chryseobacterium sp. MP_3.2]